MRSPVAGSERIRLPTRPDNNEFLAVSVLPGQTVLVGVSGVIFQTTDEGMTWTRPDSGTRQGLNGVSFAAQAGSAVGERGTILRSDDGGLSWAAQFSGTTGSLGAVSVVDVNTAIAAGEAGTILRTDDGNKNAIMVMLTTANVVAVIPMRGSPSRSVAIHMKS